MSKVKQVLVVDDHFDMLELLRTMLEEETGDVQVLGVPSAEEGYLELLRTPFDLVITDLRLPGMSGLDLVQRVTKARPDTPVIMITAYSTREGEREALDQGVFRYFRKPLDTNNLLAAIHEALYQSRPAAAETTENGVAPSPDEARLGRLEALRVDTGARQALLADRAGSVVEQAGADVGVDLDQLLPTVAGVLTSGQEVAALLGNDTPLTIQYQAGETLDLYTANVGTEHFLALFFDAATRRGRIGTIWVFAQRAVRDLVTLLPGADAAGESDDAAAADEAETAAAPEPVEPDPPPPSATLVDYDEAELGDFVADVPLAVTGELAPALDEAARDAGVDVDAFWESAVADDESEGGAGLNLEEARRQGLLPDDFELPDE